MTARAFGGLAQRSVGVAAEARILTEDRTGRVSHHSREDA